VLDVRVSLGRPKLSTTVFAGSRDCPFQTSVRRHAAVVLREPKCKLMSRGGGSLGRPKLLLEDLDDVRARVAGNRGTVLARCGAMRLTGASLGQLGGAHRALRTLDRKLDQQAEVGTGNDCQAHLPMNSARPAALQARAGAIYFTGRLCSRYQPGRSRVSSCVERVVALAAPPFPTLRCW